MFPPFDEKEAYSLCLKISENLRNGSYSIYSSSMESVERKNFPVMIGSLICKDKNNKKVKLFAISGSTKKIKKNKDDDLIFVDAIVSAEQIEKALEKNDDEIHALTNTINSYSGPTEVLESLKKKRLELTSQSQKNVFNLYSFNCIDGKKRSLKEICTNNFPPTGTGECCEPKLLNYAFKNNLQPLSMAEILFRRDEKFEEQDIKAIPPCDERCSLILPSMLGIKILYRDEDIIVVNKQSGLLSVPGRGPDKQDCIVNRVKKIFPGCIQQPAVHRLDMETSGIMVLAFTKEAHKNINKQFEEGLVKKKYVALLDGILPKLKIPDEGQMELYFRLDIDNRPHQIWDEVNGKKAVTQWKILGVERYTDPHGKTTNATRVLFIPHTGRTHQLRLASADKHGFNVPIIGDTLYGKCTPGQRLMLHAQYIKFTHPTTGQTMEFTCPAEF
ncbi:MAG: RluA family pseudouridine synthase [Treponema sp.]|nr:RluA family pseudouridine synthase [Treponema sp.]